ncbi:MAG: TonB-dependent receptor [Sulfurovaceae bacterium]|nr:TonB-dependent receptor [Sulfurovaceae bacterium]
MNKPTKYSLALLTVLTISNADTVNLGEIDVISNTRAPQKITKTTSTIEVITDEMIEQKGYINLAEAVNDIAGLATTQSGGLGQTTSLFNRGMIGGSTLIMIDGVRMTDGSTTDNKAILENISLSNVKQIEIIKGGMSSIWGGNASGGVINIITKTPKDGLHGSVNGSYGSEATYDTGFNLLYKNDKISANAGASRLKTNGISAMAPENAEKDGMNQNNYLGSITFTPDENNAFNFTANKTLTKAKFDDPYSGLGGNDAYSHSDGNNYVWSTKYIYTQDNYESILQASKADGKRVYFETYDQRLYKFTNENYSWINKYDYAKGTVTGGLEYVSVNGSNTYASDNYNSLQKADYTDRAAYISNLYNVTDTTMLETNLRYDNFNNFDDETSYKIGVKQKLGDFEARANYGKSFDAPSGYQLANTYPGISLEPSNTKGYEIGLNYAKMIDVVYFSNKVANELIWRTGATWNDPYGYANANDDTTYNGVEINFNTPVMERLWLNANYTKLFSMNETVTMADGSMGPKIRRPKETVNISLSYEPIEKLNIILGAQYIGDRLDMDYVTYTLKETGNYTLWNASFIYEINQNLNLAIYLKNMFDKDYQSVYGYNSEGQTAEAKLTYRF